MLGFEPDRASRLIVRSWKLSIGLLTCGPKHSAKRQREATPHISEEAGRKKLSPISKGRNPAAR
jgi:hypothetical protein